MAKRALPVRDAVRIETAKWLALKQQLLEQCPDLEDDELALFDTLDGETDLVELLASLARAALYREAQAAAMKPLIDRYQKRQASHKDVGKRLRAAIIAGLRDAGLPGIKHADVTLSLRPLEAEYKLINDEDIDLLPDDCIVTETVKKVDKEKLAKAYENGLVKDIVVKHNDRYTITIR